MPLDPTASAALAAKLDLIATNWNANLTQFTTWQAGTVTGGAANADGTGTGGPYYPLTDMSGTVRYFRGLQWYLALVASVVPATGGTFSGAITATSFITGGWIHNATSICGSGTTFAGTIGANPEASITNGGYATFYGSAHASGPKAVIGALGVSWTVLSNGVLQPSIDNGMLVGDASHRLNAIYVASGAISTSDAREKDWRGGLTEAEVRVATRLAKSIGVYRWKAAIAEKGDAARLHVGVLAQEVRDAFEAEGLDGRDYGLLCFDEWEATPAVPAQPYRAAVLDDDGVVLEPAQPALPGEPARPAGDRWGVRMDELALFIAAGQEARLAALEAG